MLRVADEPNNVTNLNSISEFKNFVNTNNGGSPEVQSVTSSGTAPPKKPKIPPIVLRDKSRYNDISAYLKEKKVDFGTAITVPEGVKLTPPDSDSYRWITNFSKKNQSLSSPTPCKRTNSCMLYYVVYWKLGQLQKLPKIWRLWVLILKIL